MGRRLTTNCNHCSPTLAEQYYSNSSLRQLEAFAPCNGRNTHDWPFMADFSLFFIYCIANLTVVYAAYRALPSYMVGGKYDEEADGEEFKASTALMFVAAASVGLLLMFYFLATLSKVLLVGVSIVSCLSIIFLVEPYLETCLPDNLLRAEVQIPLLGSLNCLTLVELPLGVGTVILWLLVRKTWDYAWVLNDVIAFSICVLMIASIRIPNLKVASVLLVAVLFYDVFWVYVSPYIWHKNVMVTVATGIDLPIKIVIPYFKGVGSSMIGLGDLVLPGLFSAFLLRFDKGRNDTNNLYFTTCTLGYATGLALCLLCVVFFGAAQPAMLYISPCTLLLVYIQAGCRKEFSMLWNGNPEYEVICRGDDLSL